MSDQRALFAVPPAAWVRAIIFKTGVDDPESPRVSQKFAAVAEQSSRGNEKFQKRDSVFRTQILHGAAAAAQFLDDDPGKLLGNLDKHPFKRREIILLYHLRPRHLELKTLTAHTLDENGQMQFTAPGNLPLVLAQICDPQRHVGFQLLEQALADMARSAKLPLFASQGRIVNHDRAFHS